MATRLPKQVESGLTSGSWDFACDSYGKVRHSRKACVYSNVKGTNGDRLVTVAARVENWDDARVLAAAKDLYKALKYANHVDEGYCICPKNDGNAPDQEHSTSCSDARKALRKVDGEKIHAS